MKKISLIMLAAASAGSAWASDFVDTAKVISSSPVYERVSEPRQECWTETVSSTGVVTKSAPVEDRSIGGALVGGVVGGVVGNQVGQGTGNTVATAAGAIAGAIIGDRIANQGAAQTQTTQVPQTREERRCRQVENYRDVVRGYNVTYRYNGRDITTRLPYQPGDTVQVSVGV
ncbi:MAG: glycine zipper 2TM domain-containing protein, partial [Betaproteobacteria bacterium]|nr:glycine zipper 2TM domain-containing protein [Betaproteobacteria bacterium]